MATVTATAIVYDDVDLNLLRPDTTLADYSNNTSSVFEKVKTTSPLPSGTWKIRVRGYGVTGSQTVYYSAHTQ
jgi:serine protease AprX